MGISVVDENVAWGVSLHFVGTIPAFTKTTDGGETWTSGIIETGATDIDIYSISAKDSLTAWVGSLSAAQTGATFKTTDGGKTWALDSTLNTLNITMHFWSDLEGFAIGGNFNLGFDIFRTIDGGITWTRVENVPIMPGEFNWLANFNSGFEVVGDHIWSGTLLGRMLKSTDRGQTWQIYDTPIPEGRTLSSMAFKDELNGIAISSAVSDGWINSALGYRTTDGGLTWMPIRVPENIQTIVYVPGSDGVYLGTQGFYGEPNYAISRDNGIHWETVASSPIFTMQFLSPTVGWAGGFVELGGMFKWEGEALTAIENETFPTITPNTLDEAVGSTFRFYYALEDSEIGATGENVFWDFSNIVPLGYNYGGEWVTRDKTVDPTALPEATHFINIDYGSTLYIKTDDEKSELLGERGAFLNELEDPSTVFTFPFTYKTAFEDINIARHNGGPVRVQNKNVIVDAYGTLAMPQGKIENVLRLKSIETRQDSSMMDSLGIVQYIDTIWAFVATEEYAELLYIYKRQQIIGQDTNRVNFIIMELNHLPNGQVAAKDTLLVGAFSEDFENGVPATWSYQNRWAVDSSHLLSNFRFNIPKREGKIAAINDAAVTNLISKGKLVSPAIQLEVNKHYQLTYDSYFLEGNFGGALPETARILISTDGKATWEAIDTLEGNPIWETKTIAIPAKFNSKIVHIAFDYDDEEFANLGWAVDNISLEEYTPPASHQWKLTADTIITFGHRIYSVKMVDSNIIWMTSTYDAFPPLETEDPYILKSLDGGKNWESYTIEGATGHYAFDLAPVSDSIVYATITDTAFNAVLYKTIDGGSTWDIVENYGHHPRYVHFFNKNEGWVFGGDASGWTVMSVTKDGGETWNDAGGVDWTIPEGRSLPPQDSTERFGTWAFSVNSNYEIVGDMILMGGRKSFFISYDKGYNWQGFASPLFENDSLITSVVAMKDSLTFMIASNITHDYSKIVPPKAYTTLDGGQNWIPSIPTVNPSAIHYLPGTDHSFIVIGHNNFGGGTKGTDRTDDLTNWTRVDDKPLIAMDFAGPNQGIGVLGNIHVLGDNGNIYKWEESDAVIVEPEITKWLPQGEGLLPPNYAVFDIHILDENTVWAIAFNITNFGFTSSDHLTKVLKTTDGGTTWTIMDIEETMGSISFDIHAINEQIAWINTQTNTNGESGIGLWVTKNGGVDWEQKLVNEGNIWLHFFNEMEGISLKRTDIYTTNDGGETWTKLSRESIVHLGDSEFISINSGGNALATYGDNLWFGTINGRIHYSNDKGKNWQVSSFPQEDSRVTSTVFKDESNGLAVSNYTRNNFLKPTAVIAATKDGGQTWEIISENDLYLDNITFVKGSANTYIGASTITGLTAYSNDGGATWEVVDRAENYGTIQFISPAVGWVSNYTNPNGTAPVIFKWDEAPFMTTSTVEPPFFGEKQELEVFPTPFNERLNIILDHIETTKLRLELYDLTGRQWADIEVDAQKQISHDFNQIPSGIYILKVSNGTYQRTIKVLKQ
jgi:photosystem II stability/assembly factor-like uncharacterized protein